MLNFIDIDHNFEHPLVAEPRDFKLEPTMFVTRQNMQ